MRILLVAAVIAAIPSPALSQARGWVDSPSGPAFVAPRPLSNQQFLKIYRQKLTPLREEILARKALEGGTLTEASRAEFQLRLDRINADFRRFVRKRSAQGIDGSGYIQAG